MLPNELFQISIVKCNTNYAGSLRIGLVSSLPETPLPSNINDLNVNRDVWFFSGISCCMLMHKGFVLNETK